MWRYLIPAAIIIGASTQARAVDCSPPLRPTTTDIKHSEVQNLSLARSLSEAAYNKARTEAGGSATIYGVPMGANYGEFKENITTKAQELHVTISNNYLYAYSTSGLTKDQLDAYGACLVSTDNFVVMVDAIGKEFYTISVEAAFVNPQDVLRGNVVQSANIQSANIADIKKILEGVNFSYRTALGFILKPIDGANEAGITIKV